MFAFNGFQIRNVIIVEIIYLLILIKAIYSESFIDMKKLSHNDYYFVILDTGLYLYDSTIENCSLIYQLNNGELNKENIGNNKINITELYNEQKAYIFCLINKYLFIFNEYNYKLINYSIKEIAAFNNGEYYNLMPYNIENNNISFIIAFNNDTNYLLFYFYNFNLNEEINEPKVIIFNNMNIQNKMIRCQINSNSTYIICFYYSIINSKNNFYSQTFLIKDMDLIKDRSTRILEDENLDVIKQIKIANSLNDKFFICFSNDENPICIINDNPYELYKFQKIGCENQRNYSDRYKVFYFKDPDNFMLVSIRELTTTLLNSVNNSIVHCKNKIFSRQYKEYSIIYNNVYQVVNYTNFTNCK